MFDYTCTSCDAKLDICDARSWTTETTVLVLLCSLCLSRGVTVLGQEILDFRREVVFFQGCTYIAYVYTPEPTSFVPSPCVLPPRPSAAAIRTGEELSQRRNGSTFCDQSSARRKIAATASAPPPEPKGNEKAAQPPAEREREVRGQGRARIRSGRRRNLEAREEAVRLACRVLSPQAAR